MTDDRERYRHLPPPVRMEDTVALKEVEDAPDPDGDQDPTATSC